MIAGLEKELQVQTASRIIERADCRRKLRRAGGFILEGDQQCINRPVFMLAHSHPLRSRPASADVKPDAKTERADKEGQPGDRQQAQQKFRRAEPYEAGNHRDVPKDA